MKKIIFLFFLIFVVLNLYSQPSLIKKQLSKMFFGVNFPLTRFDVREKFNSSINLFEYKEWIFPNSDYDDYMVKFKNNPLLSYTQSSTDRSISVNFKNGYDKSNNISMDMWYKIQDVSLCRNQLNEVINLFKSISYKVIEQDRYEDDDQNKKKIGEEYFIFSTLSNYKKNNHCIIISFDYHKVDNPYKENTTYTTPNGEYYSVYVFTKTDRIN